MKKLDLIVAFLVIIGNYGYSLEITSLFVKNFERQRRAFQRKFANFWTKNKIQIFFEVKSCHFTKFASNQTFWIYHSKIDLVSFEKFYFDGISFSLRNNVFVSLSLFPEVDLEPLKDEVIGDRVGIRFNDMSSSC